MYLVIYNNLNNVKSNFIVVDPDFAYLCDKVTGKMIHSTNN